jgi:hypothetical protein
MGHDASYEFYAMQPPVAAEASVLARSSGSSGLPYCQNRNLKACHRIEKLTLRVSRKIPAFVCLIFVVCIFVRTG